MKDGLGKYGVQLALIAVAGIWGYTFVVVGDAIALYPMYAFLGWRFAIAAVAFLICFPKLIRRLNKATLKRGILAGVLLSAGYIFQTAALDGAAATTPARCAFITGLYVVLVPILQAFLLRKRPRKATVLGVATAIIGLFVLSGLLSGAESGSAWVLGDTLAVICAVAYTLHMILLGASDERHDPMALAFIQLVVVAIVCSVISAVVEQAPLPTNPSVIGAILVCALFASTFAYAVQNYAQQKLPPARVALILVTEPAFGGIFGWTASGVFPPFEVVGAALMLGGMIISEAFSSKVELENVSVDFIAALEGPATCGYELERDCAVEGPSGRGVPDPAVDDGENRKTHS